MFAVFLLLCILILIIFFQQMGQCNWLCQFSLISSLGSAVTLSAGFRLVLGNKFETPHLKICFPVQ